MERAPVWGKATPLPGLCADGAVLLPRAPLLQGSDTRPYFSSGQHTVLLLLGSLPLCQPSPFREEDMHDFIHERYM